MTTTKINRILVVEDSKLFTAMLQEKLSNYPQLDPTFAETLADAEKLVAECGDVGFDLALCDLALPDAPKGEAAEFTISQNIPTVVFSGSYDDSIRNRLYSMGVVDYVIKDTPNSIAYIIKLTNRTLANRDVKVLVADDSRLSLTQTCSILERSQFQVLKALDGKEALEIYSANPDVRLLITDYAMPEMDGFELTREIRKQADTVTTAIIGLSGGDKATAARFLKMGADDFIRKPFGIEEFFSRMFNTMEFQDIMRELQFAASRDYLTGLLNRRAFFEMSKPLFAQARRGQITLTLAMIDIDHFKNVNDSHGHDVGDLAIKTMADACSEHSRDTDLVARLGGEEFCTLHVNMDPKFRDGYFEELRARIENISISLEGDEKLDFTASFGVTDILGDDMEEMLKHADNLLYKAKESGRNRICYDV